MTTYRSNIQLTYRGVIKDGKVKVDASQLKVDVPIYFSEGDRIDVVIRHSTKRRSTDQNRYYWGVVVPIVRRGLRDAGYPLTDRDTHQALKQMFLSVDCDFGLHLTPSTTELSTEQMNEFVENIRLWAWEKLKVTIPEPGEQVELKFS